MQRKGGRDMLAVDEQDAAGTPFRFTWESCGEEMTAPLVSSPQGQEAGEGVTRFHATWLGPTDELGDVDVAVGRLAIVEPALRLLQALPRSQRPTKPLVDNG
jgi:hypothetical protein